MKRSLLISLLAPLLLAACGHASGQAQTGSSSSWQSVRIDTPGVEGAACVLQTGAGSYVILSPATIDVPRNPGTLSVSCSKGEHFRGAQAVEARRIVEDGDNVYSYPASVSVPMTLYTPSLEPKVRVF